MFESSVSHVSHDDFCSSDGMQRQHAIGKVAWQRKRLMKVLWSVLHDRCQRKVQRNDISVSEESLSKSYCKESQKILFCWMRSPRTPRTKSSTSCCWWEFNSEKIISKWVRHEDPEFGKKIFRICIIRAATRAWISKTTIIGRDSLDRSSLNVFSHAGHGVMNTYVAKWRWKTFFIKNAMQEVAEKLKNWEDSAVRRKKCSKKRTNVDRTSYGAISGITNNGSLLGDQRWRLQEWLESIEDSISSTILTYWADMTVPTFLIKLLVPRVTKKKPSREVGMPQKHTREYEYSWKRFLIVNMLKWVPDDFFNYSRNLATPSRINNDVEDSEKRNWAVWERRTIAINTFYLAFQ